MMENYRRSWYTSEIFLEYRSAISLMYELMNERTSERKRGSDADYISFLLKGGARTKEMA